MITANDMARLWVKLTATFGYRFTETYGTRDPGVWRQVLKSFTPADIDAGFQRLLRVHGYTAARHRQVGKPLSIWPPNALEFREYCEQARQHGGLPSPHDAFAEAKTNSYLRQPHWSHGVIRAAVESVYEERGKCWGQDALYDEEYPHFARYYLALRDAYLALPAVKPISTGANGKRPVTTEPVLKTPPKE